MARSELGYREICCAHPVEASDRELVTHTPAGTARSQDPTRCQLSKVALRRGRAHTVQVRILLVCHITHEPYGFGIEQDVERLTLPLVAREGRNPDPAAAPFPLPRMGPPGGCQRLRQTGRIPVKFGPLCSLPDPVSRHNRLK